MGFVEGGMGAFAAGVAIVDGVVFKYGAAQVHDGVAQHALRKCRGANGSLFGGEYAKIVIVADFCGAAQEALL